MIRSYVGNLSALYPDDPSDMTVRVEILTESAGFITYATYAIDGDNEEQLNVNTIAFPTVFDSLIEKGYLVEVTQ